jgi:hypothetical protein
MSENDFKADCALASLNLARNCLGADGGAVICKALKVACTCVCAYVLCVS